MTLKFFPFELLYGRHVCGPLTILKELWSNEDVDAATRTTYQYVFDLRQRLEETAKIAALNFEVNRKLYKDYFDTKPQTRTFKPGNEVLLLLPTYTNKLLMQWIGPYIVVENQNRLDYIINVNGKQKIFHANMLKKFFGRDEDYILKKRNLTKTDLIEEGTSLEIVKVAIVEDSPSSEGETFSLSSTENKEVNISKDLSSHQQTYTRTTI